jgi:hypothetical protein
MAALAALVAACSEAARSPELRTAGESAAIATDDQSAPAAAHGVDAAPSDFIAETDHAPVTCDIRAQRTADGVLIQALAIADRDIAAEYDLAITKTGGGGSADIDQSGAVDLAAGASATLGENEISLERGAHIRAVLTLRDEGGQLCRRTFRL